MNDIMTYVSPTDNDLRVMVDERGDPWFVARDITDALGIDRTATRRLDDDEKGVRSMHTLGGEQSVLMVNEAGFYTLVLASKKPEAKQFKRWVTHEVLPSIRRTGGYISEQGIETPEELMARALLVANETLERMKQRNLVLEEKVVEDAPKVALYDTTMDLDSTYSITTAARILMQVDPGISRNKLYAFLREDGLMCKHGKQPTARGIETGVLMLKQPTRPDGELAAPYSHITRKGLKFCLERYCNVLVGIELPEELQD